MQVTETLTEGLKREFTVVVPAAELDDRLLNRLNTLKDEVRIKGFRPGKVPVSHLRRLFGKSAMAEIVQNVISEVARTTLTERNERAAMQPDFKLPEDEAEANKVLAGEADLTYTMAYEILPDVELGDFKSINVERPIAEVSDAEIASELDRLADSTRSFSPKEGKAASGDRLTIAYVGKIDGEPFEGGTDENAMVRLGSSQFIPGFAEQLEGVSTGEQKTITVTFPEDYSAKRLAGKTATFDVTVKEVASPDRAGDRRRARREARPRVAREAPRRRAPAAAEPVRHGDPPEGEAAASRPARRDAQVRAAAADGRPGVRQYLAPGHRRARSGRPDLRDAKAPPRRPPETTTARSPSAASGSVW